MTKIENFAFFLLLVFFGIISSSQAAPQGVDQGLLSDELSVQKQIDCVLGNGPCDKLGNSMKDSLMEVLSNDCDRCSPQQMVNALKMIEFMEKHHRTKWFAILQKYDQNSVKRNFWTRSINA